MTTPSRWLLRSLVVAVALTLLPVASPPDGPGLEASAGEAKAAPKKKKKPDSPRQPERARSPAGPVASPEPKRPTPKPRKVERKESTSPVKASPTPSERASPPAADRAPRRVEPARDDPPARSTEIRSDSSRSVEQSGPGVTPTPRSDGAPVVRASPSPSASKGSVSRPKVTTPASRIPYERTSTAAASRHRHAYADRGSRYAHPVPRHVRAHPHAHHAPPRHRWYRPHYTHWWVHPYHRWVHVSWAVVYFSFAVDPWGVGWVPPSRAGWSWSVGHVGAHGHWHPGHWTPVRPAAAWYGARWLWVAGYWFGSAYVDGYWRVAERSDGNWEWNEGDYTESGVWVRGHWAPRGAAPAGYSWEPGFWDGEEWVEGFWRPTDRDGYRWVDGGYNDDGAWESGYWEPTEARSGYVWIPGWFDGETWVGGYWVSDAEYAATEAAPWIPAEGVDDGWETPEAAPPTTTVEGEDAPLALPADAIPMD